MPDVSAGGDAAGLLVHAGGFDALEDCFGRGDLVGAHDEELTGGVEYTVSGEDREDRALGQECGGKVGEVRDRVIGSVGPPAGEFVGMGIGGGNFTATSHVFSDVRETHGIGVVLGVRAVGDDEDLHVSEETISSMKGVALVAVDLVESLPQVFAATLEFNVDERQAVDQDGDVIAVRA